MEFPKFMPNENGWLKHVFASNSKMNNMHHFDYRHFSSRNEATVFYKGSGGGWYAAKPISPAYYIDFKNGRAIYHAYIQNFMYAMPVKTRMTDLWWSYLERYLNILQCISSPSSCSWKLDVCIGHGKTAPVEAEQRNPSRIYWIWYARICEWIEIRQLWPCNHSEQSWIE